METQSKSGLDGKALTIFILGCMTALTPFTIDMYLPAFQSIASDFGTTVARISLSVSSYFIGMAGGQLFYGPLLDRFGRKKPLYVGLSFYFFASLACILSHQTESLIAWRFVQGLAGCVAGVASMAMVRDLFSLKDSAKVYSLLILILGTSPLLAPTIGGFLSTHFGWQSVFVTLAGMSLVLILAIRFLLKESHQPDPEVELRPGPIARGFLEILKNPKFYSYAVSAAIAFSGLFVYIVGSTVIFLEGYKVTPQQYGYIFATVAAGMIIASQTNVQFLKKYTSQQVLFAALSSQVVIGLFLVVGTYFEFLNLYTTVACLFFFLGAFGLSNPNAGALSLQPFSRNAGRAASLLGFLQLGIGAVSSTSIGILEIKSALTIFCVMAATSLGGLLVLIWGSRRLAKLNDSQPDANARAFQP